MWPRNRYTGTRGGRYTGSGEVYISKLSLDNVLLEFLQQSGNESLLDLFRRSGYFK